MSFGLVVFRPGRWPDLTIVCMAVAAFLVLQALLMVILGMWPMVWLSLGGALAFALCGLYFMRQAQRSSVAVNENEVIIKTRGSERTINRADIKSVDLLSLGDQITLEDGSTAFLPLEGDDLVQAALLLRQRPFSNP